MMPATSTSTRSLVARPPPRHLPAATTTAAASLLPKAWSTAATTAIGETGSPGSSRGALQAPGPDAFFAQSMLGNYQMHRLDPAGAGSFVSSYFERLAYSEYETMAASNDTKSAAYMRLPIAGSATGAERAAVRRHENPAQNMMNIYPASAASRGVFPGSAAVGSAMQRKRTRTPKKVYDPLVEAERPQVARTRHAQEPEQILTIDRVPQIHPRYFVNQGPGLAPRLLNNTGQGGGYINLKGRAASVKGSARKAKQLSRVRSSVAGTATMPASQIVGVMSPLDVIAADALATAVQAQRQRSGVVVESKRRRGMGLGQHQCIANAIALAEYVLRTDQKGWTKEDRAEWMNEPLFLEILETIRAEAVTRGENIAMPCVPSTQCKCMVAGRQKNSCPLGLICRVAHFPRKGSFAWCQCEECLETNSVYYRKGRSIVLRTNRKMDFAYECTASQRTKKDFDKWLPEATVTLATEMVPPPRAARAKGERGGGGHSNRGLRQPFHASSIRAPPTAAPLVLMKGSSPTGGMATSASAWGSSSMQSGPATAMSYDAMVRGKRRAKRLRSESTSTDASESSDAAMFSGASSCGDGSSSEEEERASASSSSCAMTASEEGGDGDDEEELDEDAMILAWLEGSHFPEPVASAHFLDDAGSRSYPAARWLGPPGGSGAFTPRSKKRRRGLSPSALCSALTFGPGHGDEVLFGPEREMILLEAGEIPFYDE